MNSIRTRGTLYIPCIHKVFTFPGPLLWVLFLDCIDQNKIHIVGCQVAEHGSNNQRPKIITRRTCFPDFFSYLKRSNSSLVFPFLEKSARNPLLLPQWLLRMWDLNDYYTTLIYMWRSFHLIFTRPCRRCHPPLSVHLHNLGWKLWAARKLLRNRIACSSP